MTTPMLAPAPYFTQQTRGATYTADATGIINAAAGDVVDLLNGGCTVMSPVRYSGRLLAANFNITTDQPIPLLIPAASKFRVTKITVENASVSLTTAAGGVYPAASKGGTAFVAAGQVYTALTAAGKAVDLTLANTDVQPAGTPVILSLTTAQGAPATADVYVQVDAFV